MWECNVSVCQWCCGDEESTKRERERKSWREREKELRREQTTATPHLVDSPPHPKQKQKHEKSNINCSNCKLKSRRFFQGALQVKIYENQFSTNTCQRSSLCASQNKRNNSHNFQASFFVQLFQRIFHPTSAAGKALNLLFSTIFQCVSVCAIKKVRLKSSS